MTGSVSLSICGDVERPACLGLAELRCLMDAELVADFHCREGWSRLGERWRGVRLRTLLALAGAADAAGYVTVGSGEYTAVLTRAQAEDGRVLLALEHDGAASARRAGFPRLVGPSEWDCFLSRSYVIQGMRMLVVTWTNDARGRSVFWLHATIRHGIWPSVDDQLGITPRASSDSSGYTFETQNRVSAAHIPFSSDTPT